MTGGISRHATITGSLNAAKPNAIAQVVTP
jgi:hypothetical protein